MEEQSTTTGTLTSRTLSTHCVLDCPDSCSLAVTVSGEAGSERIESIRAGGGDHPTLGDFICGKVSRFDRRLDHPDRLLYPQRRVGPKGSGRFERISWDEAVAEIVERFSEIRDRQGGEAILPYHYGGSSGYLGDGYLNEIFFRRLGASRIEKTLCAVPTGLLSEQMYGKMPGVAYEDFVHAKFILVWGANPKTSGIHLVPFLKEARARGAFVAVVDPVRNFSEREVDLHLAVDPGTDLALALGLIDHWRRAGALDEGFLAEHATGLEPLLEAAAEWPLEKAAAEAGVSEADARRLADTYAEASPAVLRSGWGTERSYNGARAVGAVFAMPALLGKFGLRGGGLLMSNSGAAGLDASKVPPLPESDTRVLNMTKLSEILNGDLAGKPPIRGLFVFNCNPVATVPDQNGILEGLAREDLFTVVSEQVMTDTAAWADILLPATTFLEQREIRNTYGAYIVGGIQPVLAPRGEAKPNHELFALLGRAFGWDDEAFHVDEETLFRRTAEAMHMAGKPVDPDRLWRGELIRFDFPGETPIQFQTVFPRTADGKVHLTPPALGETPWSYRPISKDPAYPLALVSAASPRLLTSTFGEFNLDELTVTLHPNDAAARGIRGRDEVRVFNALGEVRCRVRLSDQVKPGLASMPKGAWRKASANGRTVTALCPSHVSPVGGGACYSDARVEVAKI